MLFAGGITYLNLRGIRSTARANQVLLVFMFVVLLGYIVLAIRYLVSHQGIGGLFSLKPFYNPATFNVRDIAGATSFAALTYLGFDAVTTLAEDVKNPRRNVMLAAVVGVRVYGIFGGLLVYLGHLVWPDYNTYPNIETAFIDVTRRVGGIGSVSGHGDPAGGCKYRRGHDHPGGRGASVIRHGPGQRDSAAVLLPISHPVRNTPRHNIWLIGLLAYVGRAGDELRTDRGDPEFRRVPGIHGREPGGGLAVLGAPRGGTSQRNCCAILSCRRSDFCSAR